jgi:hypothetical protein
MAGGYGNRVGAKGVMEENEKLLEKLRGLLDGESADLTQREIVRLRQMINAYDTLLASGKLGRWVMATVIMLAAAIAACVKLMEYLVQVGKGPTP